MSEKWWLKVKGLTVKYIWTINTQEAEISDSASVPLIIWQELCDQTEYSGYWENLMIASIFYFSFLCLQVIIGIIIAVIFRQMIVCTKKTSIIETMETEKPYEITETHKKMYIWVHWVNYFKFLKMPAYAYLIIHTKPPKTKILQKTFESLSLLSIFPLFRWHCSVDVYQPIICVL